MSAYFGIKVKKANTYENRAIKWTEGHLECFMYSRLVLFCFVPTADSMAGKVKSVELMGTVELADWVKVAPLHELWTSGWTSWPMSVQYNKKKSEYACLAADLTLVTEVILYLTVSPDGSRQGDMAIWPHLSPRGRWQHGCSDRLLEKMTA